MRIDLANVVVAVSAGGVDEVLEAMDEDGGRTEPFRNWRDWGRVGLTAAGLLGQTLNYFPQLAAALAQSEITLLTKSVSTVIRGAIGGGGVTHRRTTSQTRTVAHPTGGRVLWKPKPVGA